MRGRDPDDIIIANWTTVNFDRKHELPNLARLVLYQSNDLDIERRSAALPPRNLMERAATSNQAASDGPRIERGHCVPAAYTNFAVARQKHGARADKYVQLLQHADPLADAVVEVFAQMGDEEWRRMLDVALNSGIDAVSDAPQSLRALFAQLDHVPFWLDREQSNLGGATFLRCRLGFVALAMMSLPLIYSWPAGNKPLALSGHLVHRASQRLKDTTRYVFAISQPDGLSRFSEGFKMTVKVRLIHSQVRRLLRQSGQWREDLWGAPINQCHMAGTNLLFSVGVLDALRRIGYLFKAAEREALIHLWRYAGYLLGVEDELLVAGEWEGHRLLDLIFTFEPKPDDDSRALVHALVQTSFDYVRSFKAARPCSTNLCYGISRALIGDERAEALGYPKTLWRWFVPAIWPATRLIETARCLSPAVQALAKVAGPKAFRHLLSERGLKGRAGEFLLPRRIATPSEPAASETKPKDFAGSQAKLP
jgi:hypothetical protein